MTRSTLLVILAAALAPAAASAGANQGALIAAGAGAWTKTTACATLQRTDLFAIDGTYPAPAGPNSYVAVYVAWDPFGGWGQLSVAGIDFGITYGDALVVTSWTKCGDLELFTDDWPQPGSGNTVVWAEARTGEAVLVGWFRVTVYGGRPHESYRFTLGPHPIYQGPRVFDPALNFDDLWCWWQCCAADLYSGPPVAVSGRTWGSIKAQFRD